LIQFRTFRNTDSPLLADIWRSQPASRSLAQPMSAAMLEQLVLNKSVFDREGLVLAIDNERPLGFVHASFGPDGNLAGASTANGVISALMLRPDVASDQLTDELLGRGEAYLRDRGARALHAGGVAGRDPFYLGLIGGSEKRGLLASDTGGQHFYSAHGYQPGKLAAVFRVELSRFKPVLDRVQMAVRRRMNLAISVDPPASSWWDAVTLGGFDRMRFETSCRDQPSSQAKVTYWMMQPLSRCWGRHAAGLVDLQVAPTEQRQGLATFLLCESLRRLYTQGVELVEAQVDADNEPALRLFCKLGFERVDEAIEYRKAANSAAPSRNAPEPGGEPVALS
jgi:GNAT superfamily N-acetyltransferase